MEINTLSIHSDIHEVEFHPDHPDTIYFGTDGGVYRSLNGGNAIEEVNIGYQTTQFYNGTSSSFQDSSLFIGGLQDNNTVIYSGPTTDSWVKVIGGDGSWSDIDAFDDNIMYGSWQGLNILISADEGGSWLDIPTPGSEITAFIAPFRVSKVNPSVIYAGRSVVYRSNNSGGFWTPTNLGFSLDGTPVLCMDLSYQDEDICMVGTAPYVTTPGIHLTTDGGDNWTDITGSLPDRFPTDIAFDPSDDQIAYLTFSGFGTDHVYKTMDRGASWTSISDSLPDVPHNAVVVDPLYPSHVYIGNDIGVWVSLDENYRSGNGTVIQMNVGL